MKRIFKNGWETDALEHSTKGFFKWDAGLRKAIKRAHNRRERKELNDPKEIYLGWEK
jgi:hypothetical protein